MPNKYEELNIELWEYGECPAFPPWISALGASYGFTHDLGLLLDILKSLGADCTDFADLPDLTIFAVHFRYDDAGDDCGFPERDEVLEKVAGLVAHVEQVLS